MAKGDKIFWLYRGNEVLTGVMAPPGATRREIIEKAVESHNRVPLPHETMAPFEFEDALKCAEVRQ